MSEEQVKQEKKSCKCVLMTVGVVLSLLFSIAALTLSILSFNGVNLASGSSEGGQVVISKQYDRGRSLEKALKTKKPVIVFFYTDWCGYCQRFAPTFDKITKSSKMKKNFAVAFVNCEKEENHKLMEEYGVQGFPTVFVIDQNGKKTQLENNTFFDDDSVEVVSENALKLIDD